jgi:hypothetical protein
MTNAITQEDNLAVAKKRLALFCPKNNQIFNTKA